MQFDSHLIEKTILFEAKSTSSTGQMERLNWLQEHIDGHAKEFGEPLSLRLTNAAFAVQDFRYTAPWQRLVRSPSEQEWNRRRLARSQPGR